MKQDGQPVQKNASWKPEAEVLAWMVQYRNASEDDLTTMLMNQKNEVFKTHIHQLKSLKKNAKKWPFLLQYPEIILPPGLNQEQSSSELTARYKAALFNGQRFCDLTTGMGMDAYWIGRNFKEVVLCEPNAELAAITSHNMAVLGLEQARLFAEWHAEEWLQDAAEEMDLIYLDPSRRNQQGAKTFFIEDYEPRLNEIWPMLLKYGKRIMFKTSPLLDIHRCLQMLKPIHEVHIISVENECRELVFVHERGLESETQFIAAHHHQGQWTRSAFTPTAEENAELEYSIPLTFIYEPNASLLKAGAFKWTAAHFGLKKLHPHTHLYTSETFVSHFQGRIFRCLQICKIESKALKEFLPEMKGNLSMRNFPGRTEDLRKKLGIKDGGHHYLFACTLQQDEKRLLICTKVEVQKDHVV
ncbi:MAG: RsmD family RNA methyltransferase [Bacteroidetes bacterium]|nr:RsmD family RNA methyltransferase [Bacteroidota bacterium]